VAPLAPVSLEEVRAAAERIRGSVVRTPLQRLEYDDRGPDIRLKLENLQPIGSFKLRGATNSVAAIDPAFLGKGLGTASAGNMGRAVAWLARQRGVSCTVIVPDTAPAAKLDPIRALGAGIVAEPFERWWRALEESSHPAVSGTFLHPVASAAMIAGNGTIGLELVEDLPELEAVVVPFGGGGLSSGIACAVKAMRPDVRVFAAEVEGATPFAASLAAGHPVHVEHRRSFVDGIGSGTVLAEMWPLISSLLDGSIVVSLEEVAEALRMLVTRSRVIAEGAGAAALAAALSGRAGEGPVAAVISGGNIDRQILGDILSGTFMSPSPQVGTIRS
jgi:threonine dehydratase